MSRIPELIFDERVYQRVHVRLSWWDRLRLLVSGEAEIASVSMVEPQRLGQLVCDPAVNELLDKVEASIWIQPRDWWWKRRRVQVAYGAGEGEAKPLSQGRERKR